MSKTVHIVGIGMNSATGEAGRVIASADVLIGAQRMLETYADLKKRSFCAYRPREVAEIIESSDAARFAVLMSGDVGFFSGAAALTMTLARYDVRLIAGVPTVSDFCAKLKIPWQDITLASAHGVEANIASLVRRNRRVFCLTGGNVCELADTLTGAGLGHVTVCVGERLGYSDERITKTTAERLTVGEFDTLTALIIENEAFDDAVHFGVHDDSFARIDALPMTKSEVRAVSLSKLRISPRDICYDIGAGTGSVTVEMALAAHMGQVYAIEKNEAALPVINENCRRFNLDNVTVIGGLAPDVLDALPPPDAAFIGGSSGKLKSIVAALLEKNPSVKIVINAIALESATKAITALEKAGMANIEAVQISAARVKTVAGLHMLTGQNPITVISGG